MSFYNNKMGFEMENVIIAGNSMVNLYKSYRTMKKYLKGYLPGGTRRKPRAIVNGELVY